MSLDLSGVLTILSAAPHIKRYQCISKVLGRHSCLLFCFHSLFCTLPQRAVSCVIWPSHTEPRGPISFIWPPLSTPLFSLSGLFMVSKAHTSKSLHTYKQHYLWWLGQGVCKTKDKIYFILVAEGQLAVSFSGNKVINKVMVPFLGRVALGCHGNSLWGRN